MPGKVYPNYSAHNHLPSYRKHAATVSDYPVHPHSKIKEGPLSQISSFIIPPFLGFVSAQGLTMMFHAIKPMYSLLIDNTKVYSRLSLHISASSTLAILCMIDIFDNQPNNLGAGLKYVAKQMAALGLFQLLYYTFDSQAYNQLSVPILLSAQIISSGVFGYISR